MKTKLFATGGLLFFMFSFQSKYTVTNFSGKWHTETANSSFDLDLKQIQNKISGSHCAVQMSGNSIDCVLDDTTISLTGIVENDSVVAVTFTSQVSQKTGAAKISKVNDTTIEWRIITKPHGVFHIPNHTILAKQ